MTLDIATTYLATASICALIAFCLLACLALHRVTKSRDEWRELCRVNIRDRDANAKQRDDAERAARTTRENLWELSLQLVDACGERDEYAKENERLRRGEKVRSKWAN